MANNSDIAPGSYHVVSALDGRSSIDVAGNAKGNGANVDIYPMNWTDAQVFRVSYRRDGTMQVVSRKTGRSIDVAWGELKSGANVQMWTDNDTRAQSWVAVRDGSVRVTVNGTSYPTYRVALTANTRLCLDAAAGSTTPATNLQVWADNGTKAQRWAFVPVPYLRSGGLYQVLSALDYTAALDVAGGSTANGANAQLWSRDGGNNQKWLLRNEGNGWSLRNIGSGKYLDVSSGSIRNGTNVQSWADNDTRAQRWAITTYGTRRVDGRDCQVVRLGAGNASSYVLDAQGITSRNGTNAQIWADNGQDNQRWVLVPTSAQDPMVPVPTSLGLSSAIGRIETGRRVMQSRLYPCWRCADAWLVGSNHYQWRWRRRYMRCSNSTWTGWSAWTGWAEPGVTASGTSCWVTQGVDGSYDKNAYKDLQYELQVRCVGVGEESMISGGVADALCNSTARPGVTWKAAGWSEDGLRLDYETDYPWGTNHLRVVGVWRDGRNLLRTPQRYDVDSDSSVLVPTSAIQWLYDGQQVVVEYQVGNDVVPMWTWRTWASGALRVQYNANGGMDATMTLTQGPKRTLRIQLASAGAARCWANYRGAPQELPLTWESGLPTFHYAFPFGKTFDLYATVRSGDSDAWGNSFRRVNSATDPVVSAIRPCHSWTYDGGVFSLDVREGERLEVGHAMERESDLSSLDSRRRRSVRLGSVVKSTYTAEGAIVKGASDSTVDEARALAEAGIAWYRAPNGDVARVKVAVDVQETAAFAKVKVTMEEVSQ